MKKSDSIGKQINIGSIIALLSNGIAKSSQLISRAIITRASGAFGLGLFELVLSLTRWLALIGQGGAHQTIVQFTSSLRSKEDWNGVLNVFIQSLLIVLSVTGLLCVIVFALSDWVMKTLMEGITDRTVLLQVLFLTILLSLAHFLGFYFRGLKRLVFDQAINTVAFPILVLSVSAYYYFLDDSFEIQSVLWVVIGLYGVMILASLTGAIILSFKNVKGWKWKSQYRNLFHYSWPIWINSILNASRAQFSRLLIPVFSTTVELGYFSAAYTLAFMVSFVGNSFTPVNQYLVAEAHGEADTEKIKKVYNNIVSKSMSFVILLLGGSIIFGELILGLLFGSDFKMVYPLLVILVLGESINAISGPAGNILLMTGNQKISTKIMLVGFILLSVFCVLLIPHYGAMGSAIAAAISISYINLSRVIIIRRLFGILPNYRSILKHNKLLLLLVAVFFGLKLFIIAGTAHVYVLLSMFMVLGASLLFKAIRKV
ncbi:MAG: oligosaccharide flippase family protein [Ekhidna sp.]|uniref:lipopolysaccharide biosynthesis protein n=1 Tax=Ekhidna sp. TaxID=2608089 RepID=UPI0032EB63BA